MNIDFHYGVVYIVARVGGMTPDQALTVAHACQYVDDATTPGILRFQGGETFERFATAHKTFDYANTENDQNRLVWAPFHFCRQERAQHSRKKQCAVRTAQSRAKSCGERSVSAARKWACIVSESRFIRMSIHGRTRDLPGSKVRGTGFIHSWRRTARVMAGLPTSRSLCSI